jgi:hypothetical protein
MKVSDSLRKQLLFFTIIFEYLFTRCNFIFASFAFLTPPDKRLGMIVRTDDFHPFSHQRGLGHEG